jgi:hypothetical protein
MFSALDSQSDDYEAQQYVFERYIHRSRMIGSEDYNAPEIVSEEINSEIAIEQEIK